MHKNLNGLKQRSFWSNNDKLLPKSNSLFLIHSFQVQSIMFTGYLKYSKTIQTESMHKLFLFCYTFFFPFSVCKTSIKHILHQPSILSIRTHKISKFLRQCSSEIYRIFEFILYFVNFVNKLNSMNSKKKKHSSPPNNKKID